MFRRCWTAWFLIAALAGFAQAEEAEKKSEPVDEGLRLYLVEGSVVTGSLSVQAITVETEFGTLEIPVDHIRSFTPGLDSHPEQRERIVRLIQQLGGNSAASRDTAQKELGSMGESIRKQLEENAKDEDAERRKRIQQLLTELEEASEENGEKSENIEPLIREDRVETTYFTVVGKISPQSFEVQTQFGPLAVPLADIRNARRETNQRSEVRKTVTVTGTELVQFSFKNAMRVERGDRVSIKANGTLIMSPWGNNAVSTPQGDQRYQWYIPNKIPGGALVAKIGSSGEVFMVGSEHEFVATRAGQLSFAIAMNPQYANQGYQFPGEYSVKVRVNSD